MSVDIDTTKEQRGESAVVVESRTAEVGTMKQREAIECMGIEEVRDISKKEEKKASTCQLDTEEKSTDTISQIYEEEKIDECQEVPVIEELSSNDDNASHTTMNGRHEDKPGPLKHSEHFLEMESELQESREKESLSKMTSEELWDKEEDILQRLRNLREKPVADESKRKMENKQALRY